MKNNKETIITDVDSVLLDWKYGLIHFLNEKGIPNDHIKDHLGSTSFLQPEFLFKEDKETSFKLLKEYNKSKWIGELPIFQKGSDKIIKDLSEEHDFYAVTCIGIEPINQKLRIQNLQDIYGNIFSKHNVLTVDSHETKLPYLKYVKEKSKRIKFFIDDEIKHLNNALRIGIKPVLYTNDNKKTNNKNIEIIDCWSKALNIVNKENKLNFKHYNKI
tara:strand:+ start:11526 stop:12173 length:648 start_codon:yes stop_codon:yes gene_type:complete